ncbi:MAG: Gfo/Idh/MocA family protein [Anaerolineae bacterium]
MSERQARIAFIGCGRHATANLYPCLAQIPEIKLVATCDLKEELARHNAEVFGARRWYTSTDELLDKEPELDGAIIVGSPQMMKSLGEKVLRQRRVPVFVEKPPAVTAAEAQEFAATAAECGAWGQVGFMKRFSLGYGLAKQAAEAPWFGPITIFDAKFTNGDWGPLWNIYGPGDGFLAVQAIHIFDLARFFIGPIKEVYARFLDLGSNSHGFSMTLTFESGALGSLNLNSFESWRGVDEWLSLSGKGSYVIVEDMLYVNLCREESWARLDDPMLANFSQGWKPSGPNVPDMRLLIGYRGELQEFARCILEGRRPGPDLEAGAVALRAGEAAWESVHSEKAVPL